MLEILEHILGICGDHWHPNIYTILLVVLIFGGMRKFFIFTYTVIKRIRIYNR